MNDAGLMTTILLLGIAAGLFANFLIENISKQITKIKEIAANNKLFRAKQAEVEKMKADGGMHDWVNIPTMGGMMYVCRKTGWCPTLDGFIPMSYINTYLENLKAEEDYKLYRDSRVLELSEKVGVTFLEMEKIVEQVFSIKKDFHIARIEKLQKELQDRAAAVNDGQNQV